MTGSRIRPLLILTFTVALGTGVAAGLFLSRLPVIASVSGAPGGATGGPGEAGSLADDLQLNAEQRREMKRIWEQAREKGHQFFGEVQRLQRDRDEALVSLLNDEQKARYEQVARDFADQFAGLAASREETFAKAVAETKNILNPVQQKRYEEILQKRPAPSRDWLPPPVIKGTSSNK